MKDTKVKEDGKIDYIWYKNQYDRLLREKCKYEHRIEKAVEYIKEHNMIVVNKEYIPDGISTAYDYELMNILNGRSDE